MRRTIERLETIGLGDRIWTAAITVTCSHADAGYGALLPRSLRWWVAVWNRAVRPPLRRPPKRSPLRLLFCGTPSRSTSIRMAVPAGSHQQRLPAMTSRRRCGRDRWRSPALRTCRTVPSLPGVKRASSPPLRRRNLALSTNIISSGSIGWTRWSLRTACAERFPQPISRRRIAPDSPRLWVMWKGSIF